MSASSNNNKTRKEGVRSLPVDDWPRADRDAWIAACEPSRRLKRGGAAAHLKPVSRRDFARRYGLFLDFLSRQGSLQQDAPAASQVTPDKIETYIAELKARVSSVTVYGHIYKLRRAAQLLAPGLDLRWLSEIENDLAYMMRPRSKFGRVPPTEVLVEAGLTLIREAENNLTGLARARQFRNGLMVAVYGLCPIRLKNFAALEIGRSFVNIKGKWWIVLTASETKEGRPDERPVDELLTPIIDRYLANVRPALIRAGRSAQALWLSSTGAKGMGCSAIEHAIKGAVFATTGVDFSPHLFRTAGSTTLAIHRGDNPYLGSALLHHHDRSEERRVGKECRSRWSPYH